MIKHQTIRHILAGLVSAVIIAPFVFMLADRAPPIELRDGELVPPVIGRGTPYRFAWTLIPRRPFGRCEAMVHWSIVDSEGVVWTTPPTPSLFLTLPDQSPRRAVGRERILPSGLAPGPAKFRAYMVVECNWVHHFWPIRADFPVVSGTVE